jgi:hypothetical protein
MIHFKSVEKRVCFDHAFRGVTHGVPPMDSDNKRPKVNTRVRVRCDSTIASTPKVTLPKARKSSAMRFVIGFTRANQDRKLDQVLMLDGQIVGFAGDGEAARRRAHAQVCADDDDYEARRWAANPNGGPGTGTDRD